MESVLISIIITSYNQSDFLYETILSCLNQSYPSIELIIIDDASNQSEFDKNDVASYISNNKKLNLKDFKILINDKNVGHSKSIAAAFLECSSGYVVYVNGDDILPFNSLSCLMQAMQTEEFDIVGGNFLKYDGNKIPIVKTEDSCKYGKTSLKINPHKIRYELPFTMPGALFKSKYFREILDFEVSFKYFEDLFLFIKILKKNPNIKIGKVNFCNYLWRAYSGVSGDKSIVSLRALTKDHITLILFILSQYSSSMSCTDLRFWKNKLRWVSFIYNYYDINNSSFIKKTLLILGNFPLILTKISLNRILNFSRLK